MNYDHAWLLVPGVFLSAIGQKPNKLDTEETPHKQGGQTRRVTTETGECTTRTTRGQRGDGEVRDGRMMTP